MKIHQILWLIPDRILDRISHCDRSSSLVLTSFYHDSMALTPEFLKKLSEKIDLVVWSFDDEIYSTSQTIYQAQSAHAIITTDFYVGQEIDYFSDIEELLEKVKFYLTHDTIREELAKAAYEKVHRDVFSLKSLENVFLELEKQVLQKKEIFRSDYFRFLEVYFAVLMAIKMMQNKDFKLAIHLLQKFNIFSFHLRHIYHLLQVFFALGKIIYNKNNKNQKDVF
ncbi:MULTISPECIES: glycosyltransferase [Spirulina sp. CCY15215]|uniref:glycosyltransferase n=1 Tax=Spirulina sp. CCY15215 TaxID=2767591 RepID=UPI00194F2CFB|nr:glycosyltransferase [Spirulina major]